MDRGLRYFGGAVAFGFAAVWIIQSLAAALVCLSSAAVGYAAVLVAQRMRAKLALRADKPSPRTSMPVPPRRTPETEDLARRADALNHDLGHVYEPAAPMSAHPDEPLAGNQSTTPGETPGRTPPPTR